MNSKGFALLEIVIAVAVITLIASGGFYLKNFQQQKSTLQDGNNSIKQATEAQRQLQVQVTQQNNIIDHLNAAITSSSKVGAVTTSVTVPPGQTAISWSDAKKLLKQCEVKYFTYSNGCEGIPFVQVFMKNNQRLYVNNAPNSDDLDAAVAGVSSTCGSVSIGRSIVDCVGP